MSAPIVTTYLAGLLGHGISASKARQMHEAEAAAIGLQLVYRVIDFDPLGFADSDLGRVIDLVEGMGFAGVNVTHPYKQDVIPHLTALTPEAQALGAVNTIRFQNGHRIGHNTDWSGFASSLKDLLPKSVSGKIAQIGAGGAGSATAYALLRSGADQVALFDPDSRKAKSLADRLAPHFPCQSITVSSSPHGAIAHAKGIVQTSPVGMTGHAGLPLDPSVLNAEQWLADIIYFPRETELVRCAKRKGLTAFGGLSMAIHQAASAFEIITEHTADPGRMMANFEVAFPA
jgi:shikimate dehydrogenase